MPFALDDLDSNCPSVSKRNCLHLYSFATLTFVNMLGDEEVAILTSTRDSSYPRRMYHDCAGTDPRQRRWFANGCAIAGRRRKGKEQVAQLACIEVRMYCFT